MLRKESSRALYVSSTWILYGFVCDCWGTTWLGIKVAVETIPPLTAAGLRFLTAFPIFIGFSLLNGESILIPKPYRKFIVFFTITYLMVPYYLLNYGERYVSSGITALLFSTMPVFIVIFYFFSW